MIRVFFDFTGDANIRWLYTCVCTVDPVPECRDPAGAARTGNSLRRLLNGKDGSPQAARTRRGYLKLQLRQPLSLTTTHAQSLVSDAFFSELSDFSVFFSDFSFDSDFSDFLLFPLALEAERWSVE